MVTLHKAKNWLKNHQNTVILGFIIALVLLRFGVGLTFTSASDLTPDNIAQAVNNERTTRNISALNYNSKLAAAAQYKAQDMINRDYFSHTDPDGNYIWPKIAQEGYTPYTILGENLAINFPDTDSLMSAWMDSPTHRANILNTSFQDQGIGVAFGNASAGQYAQSIANTFGAQPAAPAPKPAPQPTQQTPAPTQTTTKTQTPTKTTTKVSAPKPAQQTSKTAPATQSAQTPAQPQTPEQENLATQSNPPVFDLSATTVTAKLQNDNVAIHVSTSIVGQVSSAMASIDGQSVPMLAQAQNIYAADLLVPKDLNLKTQQVTISAVNQNGNANSAKLYLDNVPIQGLDQTSNPIKKLAGAVSQQARQPDLYNVFKYIVYFFGILFIILMITDALTMGRKKMDSLLDIGNGTNILIVLLLFGTMFFVNWWH